MDTSATILAVASPPGRSPRGIVRISGAQTFALLRPHLTADVTERRGVHAARLRVDGLDVPGLALVFPAPGSYTGEDAVELQLAGNPVLLERVIDGLISSGRDRQLEVRRAEAGEFTARAFFNGKMSLTQAEGVAAIIAARSDAQLRAGRLLADGALGGLARALADDLAGALALVEAGIDFTDQEDVVAIGPRELLGRVVAVRDRIRQQLDRAVGTEQLEALAWVVLTGAPNSGKSTLFNALLGRTRAVVSADPGTTRDVLAEPLSIDTPHGPAEVLLVDLAGADAGADPLNRQMQAAARQAVERADLLLHCVGVDETAPDAGDADRLVVRTKSDLATSAGTPAGVFVSARTGEGLEALRAEITRRLADRTTGLGQDALALRPRHEAALRASVESLTEAIELVAPARDERQLSQPELVAAALRAALGELGGLAGDITPDDVLGRIFAEFCVGK